MGRPWPLIDPEIAARSAEVVVVWDARLSFLSVFFQVARQRWVDVCYQDPAVAWHKLRAEDELSELLQHEIDHLDGILALNRVTDVRAMCVREGVEHRHRRACRYTRRGTARRVGGA